MLDQFKQLMNLRQQAKAMQEQLAQEHVTGTGAKQRVRITMDGNQDVQTVDVDPELLTTERKEELERGIQEAIADARGQIQSIMAKKLREGGMPGT